ncbi:MAG: putative metal-binding motif-containing protein [Myxococcota bacterium]
MWLLNLLLACGDLLGARLGQAEPETVGDCKSEDDAVGLYADRDSDGVGDGTTPSAWGCLPVSGYVDAGGDCDDTDPRVGPGQPEACNGVDDDCDFTVDEAPDVTWCVDADEDGFGDPDGAQVHACEAPSSHVAEELCLDCDDRDPDANPDAEEVGGNGIDDDCDGNVD